MSSSNLQTHDFNSYEPSIYFIIIVVIFMRCSAVKCFSINKCLTNVCGMLNFLLCFVEKIWKTGTKTYLPNKQTDTHTHVRQYMRSLISYIHIQTVINSVVAFYLNLRCWHCITSNSKQCDAL